MGVQERFSAEHRARVDPVSKTKQRPVWLNLSLFGVALIVGTFVYFYAPEGFTEAQRRMGAIFFMAMVLWATEAIPLFATSLLVIVGECWLIVRSPRPGQAPAATSCRSPPTRDRNPSVGGG